MDIEEKNILFLDNAIELPYTKKAKVLKAYGASADLYGEFDKYEPKLAEMLTPVEMSYLKRSARQNLDQIIAGYERDNIKIVTIYSEYYPDTLKHIDNPPFLETTILNCFILTFNAVENHAYDEKINKTPKNKIKTINTNFLCFL